MIIGCTYIAKGQVDEPNIMPILIDPLGRPIVTAANDQYFPACPSQNKIISFENYDHYSQD